MGEPPMRFLGLFVMQIFLYVLVEYILNTSFKQTYEGRVRVGRSSCGGALPRLLALLNLMTLNDDVTSWVVDV